MQQTEVTRSYSVCETPKFGDSSLVRGKGGHLAVMNFYILRPSPAVFPSLLQHHQPTNQPTEAVSSFLTVTNSQRPSLPLPLLGRFVSFTCFTVLNCVVCSLSSVCNVPTQPRLFTQPFVSPAISPLRTQLTQPRSALFLTFFSSRLSRWPTIVGIGTRRTMTRSILKSAQHLGLPRRSLPAA